MKKTVKIFIAILLIIGVCMIALAFVLSKKVKPSKTSSDELYDVFTIGDKVEEKFCKNADSCLYINPIFDKLAVKGVKNKQVLEFIETLNNNNDKQRKVMKESNLDKPDCSSLRDSYYYSVFPSTIYDLYKDDKYLSITVTRENFDVCAKKNKSTSIETILYDIEKDKILNTGEIKELFEANDEQIINTLNEVLEVKITEIQEYYLYYSMEGDKTVAYKENNIFVSNKLS